MHPRRTQPTKSPKKLRQKKLDAFIPGSPGLSTSPARSSRRKKPGRTHHDEHIPDKGLHAGGEGDGSESSDPGAIHFEPKIVNVSSSDEEAAPKSSPLNRGKRRLRRAYSEDSDVKAPSGGEEESPLRKGQGKRIARKAAPVLESDEEEEPVPKKRKLVKGARPPTPDEEEVDLMDEVDEGRIIESRLRTRDKRTAFQKNLDKLKRKKRGEAIKSDSEDEDEEEENNAAPFAHARPSGNADDDDEVGDEDEDDTFIVEDDVSQAIELPAEFSMNSYQDLLHHFKIVCQLFVHMAVQDADERRDAATSLQQNQYFSVPLKITRRKLSGMRDSLVAGSTWKPWFRKTLDKYPIFELYQLDFTVPGCDACNLGSRLSTRQGRLSGEPYDPLTYESLADSQESDVDGDESPEEVKKQFDLGRFCAKRTRTYHQFTHWEYHLFHALCDEIDMIKANREERGFVQVAYAKGKQPPEDLSDADGIMDWLDERQIISIQWQEIKTMMENARHLEVKGGKDGDYDSD